VPTLLKGFNSWVLPLASPRAFPPANKLGAPSLGPPGSASPTSEPCSNFPLPSLLPETPLLLCLYEPARER
jgi:hypothetical protein